ncbi:hypothetical protein B0H12DRAFT_1149328 [Mycena haematopus]|nr:hypothetical protein B0H12DRAFT_1149328 [Mycena haematopus]
MLAGQQVWYTLIYLLTYAPTTARTGPPPPCPPHPPGPQRATQGLPPLFVPAPFPGTAGASTSAANAIGSSSPPPHLNKTCTVVKVLGPRCPLLQCPCLHHSKLVIL